MTEEKTVSPLTFQLEDKEDKEDVVGTTADDAAGTTADDAAEASTTTETAEEETTTETAEEETTTETAEKETGDPKRYNSTIQEGETVYRTKDHGSYRICKSEAWGHYLRSITDPSAKIVDAISKHGLHELAMEELEKLLEEARRGAIELSEFERNGISLNKDFSKIPAELWSRWIALCFYMCPQTGSMMSSSMHDSQLEVQVCLLRNKITTDTGLDKAGPDWKMVIPKQIVSGVSVKADLNKCIDIETGEEYTQFPPEGWLHAGSSHSHNTMGAFFSGVDNKSELTCPGFHVVIGNINHKDKQYTYASSIVLRKMRKNIDLDEVVDTDAVENEFHQDVLDYIDTVVSANRKIYEAKEREEEQKAQSTGSALRFTQWSNDNEEGASTMLPWELQGPPSSLAEAQARNHFLNNLAARDEAAAEIYADLDVDDISEIEDLDLYFNDADVDPNFPYHSEISSIVDNALSQGYKMADVLLSLRRAKEEHDAFTQEILKRESGKMKFKHIFVIGLGGTGSHLVGPLVQLMRFHPEGTNDFHLIDGDVYEEKNATRQVIAEGQIGKNKARATAERLGGGTIKAIGEYIDKDSFTALLEANVTKDDNFLIVPCVDNHATRKATLESLEEGGYQNFVWISPGNSFDKGLVVLHIKEEGDAQTVHPASKYPDFADPEDAIPTRGDGCVNHIPSSPQLITANFTAACATLNSISNMLDEKGWYEEYHFSCRKNKLVPQLPLRGVLVTQ